MRRQVHIGDDRSVTLDLEIELTPTDGGTRSTQPLRFEAALVPVSAILWPLFMRERAQEAMDKTVPMWIAESSD
jgi:hypothetical protein